jgi:hypothetical protein
VVVWPNAWDPLTRQTAHTRNAAKGPNLGVSNFRVGCFNGTSDDARATTAYFPSAEMSSFSVVPICVMLSPTLAGRCGYVNDDWCAMQKLVMGARLDAANEEEWLRGLLQVTPDRALSF